MFGWFDGTGREINSVNKGTPEVIEYARQCFQAETLRAIATTAVEHLKRAHTVFEDSPVGAKRAIDEYRRLHKDARQRHDDVALTAFTLVTLYIRAEVQGDPCRPAIDAIDAFLGEWTEAAEP